MNSSDADRPTWRIERERPCDVDALAALVEEVGGFASHSPTSRWSGVQVDALMTHVTRVAAAVLTDRQFACFVGTAVQGKTQRQVADEMGIDPRSVQQHLKGAVRADGWWRSADAHATAPSRGMIRNGGAMSKLKRALGDDAEFQAAVLEVSTPTASPSQRDRIVGWYAPITTPLPKPQLFVAMAVLMVLSELADARGELHINDAVGHLPRRVLDPALTQLRQLGWVRTDGVQIRILRTPVDAKEET